VRLGSCFIRCCSSASNLFCSSQTFFSLLSLYKDSQIGFASSSSLIIFLFAIAALTLLISGLNEHSLSSPNGFGVLARFNSSLSI